tara:strand:+ start:109 stop:705 length:597 start_codon:yes stop_codon:yes gene_type:complete
MKEQWKEMKSPFTRYEISTCGTIRALCDHRTRKAGDEICQSNDYSTDDTDAKNPYKKVYLHADDGNSKQVKVHRLLAINFIDNPDPINKKEVDHIDGNRSNNVLENLRWASRSENCQNRRLDKRNEVGIKGIQIDKRPVSANPIKKNGEPRKIYRARIKANSNTDNPTYIARCFATLEEAVSWRKLKVKELHGEFGKS